MLEFITLTDFSTHTGYTYSSLELSFEIFGDRSNLQNQGVFICHALTGNSHVSGTDGWWNDFVGDKKTINTSKRPVICFNIPGNFYDSKDQNLISNYTDWNVRDVARAFCEALSQLGIDKMHAVLGGSLGGGIAWEMSLLKSDMFSYLIPIASHYQSSDWIIGHNKVQMEILETSSKPLEVARMMATLFFRTPLSFVEKFNRTRNTDNPELFNVETYLLHQGKKFNERYNLSAYKLMIHLWTSIDIAKGRGELKEVLKNIQSKIVMIGIEPDNLFSALDNKISVQLLRNLGKEVEYRTLKSIHGHDAFLLDFKVMNEALRDVLK